MFFKVLNWTKIYHSTFATSLQDMTLEGFTPYKKEDVEKYNRLRCWAGIPLCDILDKAADIYPAKEALVDGEKRFTYAQLKKQTDKFAIGFIHLGIKPLDRILVQLPNWTEFIYIYFALQKIGAIPILLLAKHRQHEIRHLLQLTEASSWVVAERYHKTDYLPIIDDVLQNSDCIESLMTTHPGIIAAAVVPMPDPELGERICAYVQRASGAELDFAKIISFLKDQGASVLQLPERIEFVDEMPYTKAEKIYKQALAKDIKMKIKIKK